MAFQPRTLDGIGAPGRLLAMHPYRKAGLCLEAVWAALNAGTSDNPGYYTFALRGWYSTPIARRYTNRNIPKGAVVYLSAGANGYGHICLSLGGDQVVSTDTPSGRSIGVTTITALCKSWGRTFVGWSDYIGGHSITVAGGTASTATPVTTGDSTMSGRILNIRPTSDGRTRGDTIYFDGPRGIVGISSPDDLKLLVRYIENKAELMFVSEIHRVNTYLAAPSLTAGEVQGIVTAALAADDDFTEAEADRLAQKIGAQVEVPDSIPYEFTPDELESIADSLLDKFGSRLLRDTLDEAKTS